MLPQAVVAGLDTWLQRAQLLTCFCLQLRPEDPPSKRVCVDLTQKPREGMFKHSLSMVDAAAKSAEVPHSVPTWSYLSSFALDVLFSNKSMPHHLMSGMGIVSLTNVQAYAKLKGMNEQAKGFLVRATVVGSVMRRLLEEVRHLQHECLYHVAPCPLCCSSSIRCMHASDFLCVHCGLLYSWTQLTEEHVKAMVSFREDQLKDLGEE